MSSATALFRSTMTFLATATALGAQPDWRQLTPTTLPSGRAGHAMAYDEARDQVVMFGGNAGGQFTNDTWIWDGVDWTQVFPTNVPPARAGHPMAYHPRLQKVILYGGIPVGGGALNDTWEWDGTNWTRITTPTAPPQKRSQPLIYYPPRDTLVAWGGYDGAADQDDLWEYDGTDWQPIPTMNAPSPRRATDMAYDPVTGGILLFSGFLSPADTWFFDGMDWNPLTPNTSPPPRVDHTMLADPLRGRIVMFGDPFANDTWEWDGTDWTLRQPTTSPPARSDDYLVWDGARQRMLMFGGGGMNDLWEYATNAPASIAVAGAGCPGTAGTPSMRATGLPWTQSSFDIHVDNVGSNAVLLLLGLSNTNWLGIPLPLDLSLIGAPGCTLYVSIDANVSLFPNNGTASLTAPIPPGPLLAGVSTYFQALVFDPPANAFGWAASDVMHATIGIR